MRYTISWTPRAQQQLAAVWLAANDREAVTLASNLVDDELENDPDEKGDFRFDTVRSLVIPPLGIEFEIIADDRLVFVIAVWELSGPVS